MLHLNWAVAGKIFGDHRYPYVYRVVPQSLPQNVGTVP
jgi:hypothetical protein